MPGPTRAGCNEVRHRFAAPHSCSSSPIGPRTEASSMHLNVARRPGAPAVTYCSCGSVRRWTSRMTVFVTGRGRAVSVSQESALKLKDSVRHSCLGASAAELMPRTMTLRRLYFPSSSSPGRMKTLPALRSLHDASPGAACGDRLRSCDFRGRLGSPLDRAGSALFNDARAPSSERLSYGGTGSPARAAAIRTTAHLKRSD